jgi:hypothetical protein
MLTALYVHVYTWVLTGLSRRDGEGREAGQATTEYALVLLGAAAIALLVVGWATKSNKVGHLLDRVLDQLIDRVR